VASASILLSAEATSAAMIVADFNDLTIGTLNNKGGGTGLSGNWTGSAGGSVVANDLTSTLYNRPQAGNARRARSENSSGLRQNYRTIAVSPTGTVWFSFLARAEASASQAGLSINAPTPTPFNDPGTFYAYLSGSTLQYQFGAGTAGSAANVATVNSTALVVGRITIAGSGGADAVTLWVNPDLIANPNIDAYTPVYNNASVNALDTFSHIGVVASRFDGGNTGAGNVDNIRISDGNGNAATAYTDVTGVTAVPEPTSLALLSLGGVALLGRRRSIARKA
jgi:hypothetical protein